MDYKDYINQTAHVNELANIGAYDQATKLLEDLINRDISDIDKSITAYNLAVIAEKQNDLETAAYWYEQGVLYETPFCRITVTLRKATFLFNQNKIEECKEIYEKLLVRPYVTEQEKEHIRQKLATI